MASRTGPSLALADIIDLLNETRDSLSKLTQIVHAQNTRAEERFVEVCGRLDKLEMEQPGLAESSLNTITDFSTVGKHDSECQDVTDIASKSLLRCKNAVASDFTIEAHVQKLPESSTGAFSFSAQPAVGSGGDQQSLQPVLGSTIVLNGPHRNSNQAPLVSDGQLIVTDEKLQLPLDQWKSKLESRNADDLEEARAAQSKGVPCRRVEALNRRAWVMVLDFRKRYDFDSSVGRQECQLLCEAPRPTAPGLFESNESWMTHLEPHVVTALKQMGITDTELLSTSALKPKDLVEPESLPWKVKVNGNDMLIKYPLPGASARIPWGMVNRIEPNGDAYCTLVIPNGERHWEKVRVEACIPAQEVSKLRPKRMPSLEQVFAATHFEDLISEFPRFAPYLQSQGADMTKCSQVWERSQGPDANVRTLLSEAYTAECFQSMPFGEFPGAFLLTRKILQTSVVSPIVMTFSHKPLVK